MSSIHTHPDRLPISYYNADGQLSKSAFEIICIDSFREMSTVWKKAMGSRNGYVIIWLSSGTAIHISHNQRFHTNNILYYQAPGNTDYFDFSPDAGGYMLYFSRVVLSEYSHEPFMLRTLMTNLHFPAQPTPKSELLPDMALLFQALLSEYQQHSTDRPHLIRSYLTILLAYLFPVVTQHDIQQVSATHFYETFFLLLEENFCMKRLVTEYAADMFVTPGYLNVMLKKETGKTASWHIRNKIIAQAKRFAIMQGMSMKETAYSLGFDDPSHFSKFFKSGAGMNYSDFKKCQGTLS